MEIILVAALGALAIWWFFLRKDDKKSVSQETAPYKVESPQPAVETQPPVAEKTEVKEPAPAAVTAQVEIAVVPAEVPVVPVVTEVVEPKPAKTTKKQPKADSKKPAVKKAAKTVAKPAAKKAARSKK